VGTEGRFDYDYDQPEQLTYVRADGSAQEIAVQTHESRFAGQLDAFADHVAKPSAPTQLATVEDGLAVSRLIASAESQVACPGV
jgi:hypothetical protein